MLKWKMNWDMGCHVTLNVFIWFAWLGCDAGFRTGWGLFKHKRNSAHTPKDDLKCSFLHLFKTESTQFSHHKFHSLENESATDQTTPGVFNTWEDQTSDFKSDESIFQVRQFECWKRPTGCSCVGSKWNERPIWDQCAHHMDRWAADQVIGEPYLFSR